MRGQFFIISAVIIVAAIVLISQFLFDFNRYDVTKIEQMQEVKYVSMIKKELIDSASISYNASGCLSLDEDIMIAEESLKESLIFKGLYLNVTHDISCPVVNFWFNLRNENINATSDFALLL